MGLFQKSNNKQQPGQKKDETEVQLALDIGSSKIRLIAGKVLEDKSVLVLGYMEVPSVGVSKGAVTDIALLSSAIADLIRKFTDAYKINVDHLTVGFPSCFALAENQQGTATVQSGKVTAEDRDSAIKNAKAGIQNIDETKFKIVHIIPQNYITETSDEIYNPIGQYAKKIGVCVHIIGIKLSHIKNIESVLKSINPDLRIDSDVNNDNAASDAVLTESEKEIGVCHIDIGKGTVGVSVYDKKHRVISFGINDGGVFIDDEIARFYGINMNVAEKIRIQLGVAREDYLLESDYAELDVHLHGSDPNQSNVIKVKKADISYFINKNLTNIFCKVIDHIDLEAKVNKLNGKSLSLGAGFVITGGVAKTPYIDQVLENIIFNRGDNTEILINRKFRIGIPRGVEVAPGACDKEILEDPDKSVIIGLLRCAQDSIESQLEQKRTQNTNSHRSFMRGMVDWFKREL